MHFGNDNIESFLFDQIFYVSVKFIYPASRGKPPAFLITALFLSDFERDHKAKALPRTTLTGRGSSSSSNDSRFPNCVQNTIF